MGFFAKAQNDKWERYALPDCFADARNDGVGGREILNKLLRKQNHAFAPAHPICRLRPERIELAKLYFRLPLGVSPRKAEPLKSRNFTGAE